MEYLNNAQFLAKFGSLWDNANRQFFKLEMLQEYDEHGIIDWSEVDSFQCQQLIRQAQNRVFNTADADAQKFARGFEAIRIRYISYPLSKYTLIELSSYAAAQEVGDKIFVLEDKDLKKLSSSKLKFFHDFLLFDDFAVLKIDNPNGITKCSAFYSEDAQEITGYLELKDELLSLAQPLNNFLERLNLSFVVSRPDDI